MSCIGCKIYPHMQEAYQSVQKFSAGNEVGEGQAINNLSFFDTLSVADLLRKFTHGLQS